MFGFCSWEVRTSIHLKLSLQLITNDKALAHPPSWQHVCTSRRWCYIKHKPSYLLLALKHPYRWVRSRGGLYSFIRASLITVWPSARIEPQQLLQSHGAAVSSTGSYCFNSLSVFNDRKVMCLGKYTHHKGQGLLTLTFYCTRTCSETCAHSSVSTMTSVKLPISMKGYRPLPVRRSS